MCGNNSRAEASNVPQKAAPFARTACITGRHPKSLRYAPGRKVLPNEPAQALISAPCMSANCLERFSSLVSLSIEKIDNSSDRGRIKYV
jgi:hypothetical protein